MLYLDLLEIGFKVGCLALAMILAIDVIMPDDIE